MSFVEQQLDLGKNQPCHKFKLCGKCHQDKPPEGGIEMGQRWICAACWVKKVIKRSKNEV